jgi:hypothetical protein
MIEINKRGIIRSGDYQGWTVFIQDDSENTGGFLILIEQGTEGYDDWVEDRASLEKYFEETNWVVDWEK